MAEALSEIHPDDLPDVTHLCGSQPDDEGRAAFERYRTAWDLALYAPSVTAYRAVVAAHDRCMDIIKRGKS